MPVNTRLQVRRGSAADWTSANPTLYAGEIGYETDLKRFKIGDGSTAWNSLCYTAVPASGFIEGNGIDITTAADCSTVTIAVTGVSVSGHTHTSSQITDFVDSVNDRVYDLLTNGSGIQLSYTDNNNDTSTLQISATGLALSNHTHTSSQITDFNSSVSGLLPVKDIVSGSGISVSGNAGTYTISLSDPTIQSTDITDFNSAVSGLLPSVTGSGYAVSSFAGNVYTISVTGLQPSGSYALTSTTLTAGSGLTGGGDLSTNRTFNVGAGDGITVETDAVSVDSTVVRTTGTQNIGGLKTFSNVTVFSDGLQATTGNFTTSITGALLNIDSVKIDNSTITSNNNLIDFADGIKIINGSAYDTQLVFGNPYSLVIGSGTNTDTRIKTSAGSLSLVPFNGNVNVSGTNIKLGTTNNNVTVTTDGAADLLLNTNAGTNSSSITIEDGINGNVKVDLNGSGKLLINGAVNTTGTLTVGGDLIVSGTTTTVNSTTVEIGDNIIRVNTSGAASGGFEVYDGVGYKSLIWDNNDNRWEFTGPAVQSTGTIIANILESTVSGPTAPLTVASTGLVTNLNSDLLDNQHGSYYLNYNNFTNTPTIGTGVLTLNVSGSGLSGSASFGANDTGNTTFTVTSNATPSNTANTIVARNGSGNFTASTITASGLTGIDASNPVVISYATIDGGTP